MLALIFAAPILLNAQDIVQVNVPLRASLVAEQISLPTFKGHGGRWGYGLSFGSGFTYKSGKKLAFAQGIDLYATQHREYGSAFQLLAPAELRLNAGKVLIGGRLGPGLMLFYNYSPVYQLRDGVYQQRSPLQFKFSGILGVSLGYITRIGSPYAGYSILLESPFVRSGSAFLPHQLFELGMRWTLKLKKDAE